MTFPQFKPALLVGGAASVAALAALFGMPMVRATDATADALRTAERACLEQAGRNGFRSDLSRVTSSRSLGADKVKVVLQVSRDGVSQATLTCPYTAGQGVMAMLEGKLEAGSQKQSPYASAKDDSSAAGVSALGQQGRDALEPLNGKVATGSEKESPYSAAKEQGGDSLDPALAKLWGLLLPLGLALGSYAWLRQREGS